MVEIALLGGVSVEVDGAPLSGEAAQRRRVALLALLANPGLRPVSRDQLIGGLWPDHDADSARHLLSSALYVLRRALGPDALQASGDDVALNAGVVHSDVAEFRKAVAAGEAERALTLYAGDFMDGFFVNDAADFTQWVETERAELRRLYGTALERAARLRADAGDAAGAAEAWRRRASLDPYDAPIALGLMRALVAANLRTAAIQHARVHAMLLEQEFGASPDPQVEAYAAELRQLPPQAPPGLSQTLAAAGAATLAGEPASAPSSPSVTPPAGPAGAPGDTAGASSAPAGSPPRETSGHALSRRRRARRLLRRWVVPATLAIIVIALALRWEPGEVMIAVRPFTSNDSALGALAAGLYDDVLGQLERIERVRVIAADVVERRADLDSREVNRLLGSDYVTDLRLHHDGSELHGTFQLADTLGVNILNTELVGRDEAELRERFLDRVASALKRKLKSRSPSLVAADAADTAAMRHYFTARGDWRRRTRATLTNALYHFQQAVRIQPDYAVAWAGLAETLALLGSYDYAARRPRDVFPAAESAAVKARRLDPSLADAHAALGLYHTNYSWRWEDAEAHFQRALRNEGDLASVHEWYALLLAARGRLEDAKHHAELAVQEEPDSPIPIVQRAHIHYYAGEYAEAATDIKLALALDSTFLRAHLLGAVIKLVSGQEQQALPELTAFRARAGDTEPVLIALQGYAQARTGDRQGALDQLRWLSDAPRQGQYVPRELLALVHVGLRDFDAAFAELERAYADQSSGLVYLRVEPLIAPLHSDPRYQRLLARVHGRS